MYDISKIKSKQQISKNFIRKHFNIVAEQKEVTEYKPSYAYKIEQKIQSVQELQDWMNKLLTPTTKIQIQSAYYGEVKIRIYIETSRTETEWETINRLKNQVYRELQEYKDKEKHRETP